MTKQFLFQAYQRGHGIGRAGAQPTLDRKALVDLDLDFGCDLEPFECQRQPSSRPCFGCR